MQTFGKAETSDVEKGMSIRFGPVFPVLPSYQESGDIDFARTTAYVRHLSEQGARTLMTTAGTTQFNLLSAEEILALNKCVADAFPGRVILGAPAMSEVLLKPFLARTLVDAPNAELLISYPDRFYRLDDVTAFFARLARAFPSTRLHLHGLPMRAASEGGMQDFTGAMVLAIMEAAPQVVGMKEECSSYEAGFNLCSKLSRKPEFELIVAGGSMRRFLLLQAAGAQSFFAGVGSLDPAIEIAFYDHMVAGRLREACSIVSEVETPLFDVFMDVGWHKALRYAASCLGLTGPNERLPMTTPSSPDMRRIEHAVSDMRERANDFRRAGVL